MTTGKLLSLFLAGVTGMLAMASDASATNINTHAALCANYNAGEANDLDRLPSGVRNLNSSTRYVLCSIPRSPLASGATSGAFYIDGSNSNGASTSCTLYSYNFNGEFLASRSFTSSASSYDQYITLPSSDLPTYAYTAVLCALPPNGNGVLWGMTSVQ